MRDFAVLIVSCRMARWGIAALALGLLAASTGAQTAGEPPAVRLTPQILDAVVRVHAEVTPGARTAAYLGSQREGSGVLIDADGLIGTIGYLLTEALTIQVTPGNGKKGPA